MNRVKPDESRFDQDFDREMAECPWRGEPDYGWDSALRVAPRESKIVLLKDTH